VQRSFCAHKQRRIDILYTEPLPQRNLCTEQPLHKETFTQKSFDTEKLVHTDCAKKSLHTETFARRNFTQSSFYAQKLFRTEAFTHRSHYAQQFLNRRFFTQMPLHRKAIKLLHREACAHSTLLHTANFYTERLCFPFLITYLSCSPSQVWFNRDDLIGYTWENQRI
jgi:hypothetical protein